jgi:outer membrane protein TolC
MKDCVRLIIGIAVFVTGCARVGAPPPTPLEVGAGEVLGSDVVVEVIERPAEAVDAPRTAAGMLELSEAVRLAVLHDPRLQAALARLRAARAEAEQARLLPNPILNVAIRFRAESPVIDAALAEDLLTLLQRPRRASAADHRLRAAAGEVLSTLADVVSDVQESYHDVQALTDEMAALEDRRKLAERMIEIGNARFKAGETSSLDVTTLQAQRLDFEVSLAEKRQELHEARLTLARSVGNPSAGDEWTLAPWRAPLPPRAAERAWLEAAMRHRSELQSKRWELSAFGDEVALTQLAWLEGGDFGVMSERDLKWSAGPSLTVPIPLFDWGQAKYAKAAANLAEARHQMVQLQRQVVQDVRTQYSAYGSAVLTLRLAREELLPLQERRSAQAESSYRAGETDVATLLLAEEDLLDARIKVIELQRKAAAARVKLQRAVGGSGVAAAVEATAPATQPSTAPATQGVNP